MFKKTLRFAAFTSIFLFVLVVQTSQHKTNINRIVHIFDGQERKNEFNEFLSMNPQMVSTKNLPGVPCGSRETLAHYLATLGHYDLLAIMVAYGETGLVKTSKDRCGYNRNAGSTAFLALCFNIRNVTEYTGEAFLSVLSAFLSKNPSVVTVPRDDGMTSAMAVASSNSPLKFTILEKLISHHPRAFDGETSQGNSISDILIKTRPTEQSVASLGLIFKNQRGLPGFAKKLERLKEWCRENNKGLYVSTIDQYLESSRVEPAIAQPAIAQPQPVPHTQPKDDVRQHRPYVSLKENRFNDNGQCLCCQQGCNCCISPNLNVHTAHWQEFYENNPTHPNAAAWNAKLRQPVQPVDLSKIW